MRRRQHVAQKIKMLKEIRSFEREGSEEFLSAQKLRANEVIAAWRIRYYIELYRLNVLKKAATSIERHNQHLQSDLHTAREVETFLRQELNEQKYALDETATALTDSKEKTASQAYEVIEISDQLRDVQHSFQNLQLAYAQLQAAHAQEKQLNTDWDSKYTILQHELHITRLTCQDMIKHSATRENAYNANFEELETTQQQLTILTENHETLVRVHEEVLENARMREEDVEIRIYRYNQLMFLLQQKDEMIKALNKEVAEETQKIVEVESLLAATKNDNELLHIEKESMHRVIGDLALHLQTTQHKLQTETQAHAETRQQMELMRSDYDAVVQDRDDEIASLQAQLANLDSHVATIKEENAFLGQEVECVMMQSEDYFEHFRVSSQAFKRASEFSRFLEEELYAARHGRLADGLLLPVAFQQQLASAASTAAAGANSGRVAMLMNLALAGGGGGGDGIATAGAGVDASSRRQSMMAMGNAISAPLLRRTLLVPSSAPSVGIDAHSSGEVDPIVAATTAATSVMGVSEKEGHQAQQQPLPTSKQQRRRKATARSISSPTIQEHENDEDLLEEREQDQLDTELAGAAAIDSTLIIADYMDQKFISLVNILEEKMSSVDRATSTLKILMEKAESLERMQNTRRQQQQSLSPQENPLLGVRRAGSRPPLAAQPHPLTPSQMVLSNQASQSEEDGDEEKEVDDESTNYTNDKRARTMKKSTSRNNKGKKGKRSSAMSSPSSSSVLHSPGDSVASESRLLEEQRQQEQQLMQEKSTMIEEHLQMEHAFLDMQANLKMIGDELRRQKTDIGQLQDLRIKCKSEVSRWRKEFRKLNNRDATDEERNSALGNYMQHIDYLRDQISMYKANNLTLNAKAIAIQTELYHLNSDLEHSALEFVRLYPEENITTYYPEDLIAAMHSDSPTSQLLSPEQQAHLLPPYSPVGTSGGIGFLQMGKSFSPFLDTDPLLPPSSALQPSAQSYTERSDSRQWMSPDSTTLFANHPGSEERAEAMADPQMLQGAEAALRVFGQTDTITGAGEGGVDDNASAQSASDTMHTSPKKNKKGKSKAAKNKSMSSMPADLTSVGSSTTLDTEKKSKKKSKRNKKNASSFAVNDMNGALDDSFLMTSDSFMGPNSIMENPYLSASQAQDMSMHPLVKTETHGIIAPIDMIRHGTFLKMVDSDSMSTLSVPSRMDHELQAMWHAVEALREDEHEEDQDQVDQHLLPTEDSLLTTSQTGLGDEQYTLVDSAPAEDAVAPTLIDEEELQRIAEAQAMMEEVYAPMVAEELCNILVDRDIRRLVGHCLQIEEEVQFELRRELQRRQDRLEQEIDQVAEAAVSIVYEQIAEVFSADETWVDQYLAEYEARVESAVRLAEVQILERLWREEVEYLKEEKRYQVHHRDWTDHHGVYQDSTTKKIGDESNASGSPFKSSGAASSFSPVTTKKKKATKSTAQQQEYQQRQELLKQLQVWRTQSSKTKSEIEALMITIQGLMEEIQFCEQERLDIKDEILHWHRQFQDLCGHGAEISDLQRSKVFVQWAQSYREIQLEAQRHINAVNEARDGILTKTEALASIQIDVEQYQVHLRDVLQSSLVIDVQEFVPPQYTIPAVMTWEYEDAFTMQIDPNAATRPVSTSSSSRSGPVTASSMLRAAARSNNNSGGAPNDTVASALEVDYTHTPNNSVSVPATASEISVSKEKIRRTSVAFVGGLVSSALSSAQHSRDATPTVSFSSSSKTNASATSAPGVLPQSPNSPAASGTATTTTAKPSSTSSPTKKDRSAATGAGSVSLERAALMVAAYGVAGDDIRSKPSPSHSKKTSSGKPIGHSGGNVSNSNQKRKGNSANGSNNGKNKAKKRENSNNDNLSPMVSAVADTCSPPVHGVDDDDESCASDISEKARRASVHFVGGLLTQATTGSRSMTPAQGTPNTAATPTISSEINNNNNNIRRSSMAYVSQLVQQAMRSPSITPTPMVLLHTPANATQDGGNHNLVDAAVVSLESSAFPRSIAEALQTVRALHSDLDTSTTMTGAGGEEDDVFHVDFSVLDGEQPAAVSVPGSFDVGTNRDANCTSPFVSSRNNSAFSNGSGSRPSSRGVASNSNSTSSGKNQPRAGSPRLLHRVNSSNISDPQQTSASDLQSQISASPSNSSISGTSPRRRVSKPSTVNTVSPQSAKDIANNAPAGNVRSNSSRSSNRSPSTIRKSSGSIASAATSTQSPASTGGGSTFSPAQLDSLKLEYVQLRRELREWKQSFIAQYYREPTLDDFRKLPQELQIKIARKNKLKQLLTERQMIDDQPSPASTSGKF